MFYSINSAPLSHVLPLWCQKKQNRNCIEQIKKNTLGHGLTKNIQDWFVFFYHNNYIDLLVTRILIIKVTKQDNTGQKTYIRHIPLNINSVHRFNIKYMEKI